MRPDSGSRMDEPTSTPPRRRLHFLCGAAFVLAAAAMGTVQYFNTVDYVAYEKPRVRVVRLVEVRQPLPEKYNFHFSSPDLGDGRYGEPFKERRQAIQEYEGHFFVQDGHLRCLYDIKGTHEQLALAEKKLRAQMAKMVGLPSTEVDVVTLEEIRIANPAPVKRWPW